MSGAALVDISQELEELGLQIEYITLRTRSAAQLDGFVVRLVKDGSAAAQCGRVQQGDIVVEYNSVALQPLQGVRPAVRKHGVRPGKFAFLRLLKENGSYVECAIERSELSAPVISENLDIGTKTCKETRSNGIVDGMEHTDISPISMHSVLFQHAQAERAARANNSKSPGAARTPSPGRLESQLCFNKSLTVDRSSRPPCAVEKPTSIFSSSCGMDSSSISKRTDQMRWKTLGFSHGSNSTSLSISARSRAGSTASPGKNRDKSDVASRHCRANSTSPAVSARSRAGSPSPAKNRGWSEVARRHCQGGTEEQANLMQALVRIEELSRENDLLRAKLIQHEKSTALLTQQGKEQQEEVETRLQKVMQLNKERESSYQRQIASLKEEAISTNRKLQEMNCERAEQEWLTEKGRLPPSIAISQCLEAVVLKIFSVKPALSDPICSDAYKMMYSWCFEKWISPTLSRNIAGGTRMLARDEALKDFLLDFRAMEAMVHIATNCSEDNNKIECAAVEHAVASLANFALKHPRSRAILVQSGGMPVLIKLLNSSTSPSMLEKVSAAISHTLCSKETKNAFCEAGGIQALVKLMTPRCMSMNGVELDRLFEEVARAFRNLAHGDLVICRHIMAAGGTDVLVQACDSSRCPAVITQCKAALANLACDEACRATLKKDFCWTKDFGNKRLEALALENIHRSNTLSTLSRASSSSSTRRSASPARSTQSSRRSSTSTTNRPISAASVGQKTSTSPGAKNCSYNGSKSLQRSHSEVCIRLRDTESDAESDIDGRSLYPASPLVRSKPRKPTTPEPISARKRSTGGGVGGIRKGGAEAPSSSSPPSGRISPGYF